MIKNKEDDFLGDKISNNIKFADNEWQASGTVDRGSCYTKESILHTLFEGFNYQREVGDYKLYVPRASTLEASIDYSTVSSEEVGAKAEHDLLLLDNNYYLTTENSCEMNIFTVEAYLKKAIALANPVFNEKARVRQICMLDESTLEDSKTTLGDFFKALNPLRFYPLGTYPEESENKIASISARKCNCAYLYLLNRYLSSPVKLERLNEFLALKLKDFLNYRSAGLSVRKQNFLNDFSLYFHDKDSALLPFNVRGSTEKGSSDLIEPTEEKDFRTYFTRFINNVVTKSVIESSLVNDFYVESLNELVENSLFANLSWPAEYKLYTSRQSVDQTLETNKNLGEEVLATLRGNIKDGNRYYHLINLDLTDLSTTALRTLYNSFAQNIDSFPNPGAIASYVTPVYLASTSTNKKYPKDSWGIHLMEQEDASRILQQDTEAYAIFNRYLVGYKLADALISTRTFLGGVYYIFQEGLQVGNTENPNESGISSLANDVPFRIRTVNTVFSKCYPGDSGELGSLDFYPTISTINTLYKLGHNILNIDKSGSSDTDSTLITLLKGTEELSVEYDKSYDFAPEIKEWLENECFIFKSPIYGDYVEELNFQQDLSPDSDVAFKSLKVKKTTLDLKRLQDSKYETPYLEQTTPLLNLTPDEDVGFGVYANDSFAAIGNLKGKDSGSSRKTIPPQFYDYDKDGLSADDNSFLDNENIDPRVKNNSGLSQRVTKQEGTFVAESRIISPTIDEINTLLKYLIESDGRGVDGGFNERLPSFYGILKSQVSETLEPQDATTARQTFNKVNPLSETARTPYVDILSWKPNYDDNTKVFYTSTHCKELQYGGYTVTRYIEKVYDYKVDIFGRRNLNKKDRDVYEFNTEESGNYNKTTGYLEKLFNEVTLFFDLTEIGLSKMPSGVTPDNLSWDPLKEDATQSFFNSEKDKRLITDNSPVHATVERDKAFKDLSRILTWHKAKDGTLEVVDGKETSYHNHYKEYLKNPKNLKEIERDLETLRQNLQALSEYMVATSANLGYADRGKNRGNLHQLHKNSYNFLSTWLVAANNCYATVDNTKYNFKVVLEELSDTLNNTGIDTNGSSVDDLLVTSQDQKVVFDDGYYLDRYDIENYDKSVIDLNSSPIQNTRSRHQMYRPNETLLSEVYLAADGTWRSVHEHLTLPIIYSDM